MANNRDKILILESNTPQEIIKKLETDNIELRKQIAELKAENALLKNQNKFLKNKSEGSEDKHVSTYLKSAAFS